MLLDNYKKQSPIIGVAGMGGGINSYIFLSSGSDPYVISKSLRFNSADTPKLTRTPSSASNRKTWTLSFWIKRTTTGSREQIISAAGSKNTYVEFQSDKLMVEDYEPGVNLRLWTTRVFRDPSAWYHIVVAMDTTQATSSNRVKIYVNGVQETVYDTATYPSQNYDTSFNNTGEHKIGQFPGNANFPLNAYLADYHLVDGQQLAPTEFGSTDDDGIWQPKKFSGAHGTNGFHLDFKDSSSIGNDASGSNNWTANNITTAVYGLATANQGMDVVAYTGNGSTRSISSLNFSPDLVWFKNRGTTNYHQLHDRVRGPLKRIYSNSTDAENDYTTALTSFDSNGWTMGNGTPCNANGNTYVAWCWKAGGSAVSNTDGSGLTNVQVSANTSYGFSIVTYTGGGSGSANSDSGDSFGHGLSSAPKIILCKRRNAANGWPVYHASTALGALSLNSTVALDTASFLFAKKHPTSSVVYLGNNPEINATGSTYVAYCWSEIAGFSKISSYTGNGSNTGPVVTTGFKPRFLVVKRTDGVGNWTVYDSARSLDKDLKWNTNEAETTIPMVFLDDGFQPNTTTGSVNANGGTYVYMAFASKPDQSAIDVLIDSPSQSVADQTDSGVGGQITGNYATWNPLNKPSQMTLSNGNLDCQMGSPDSTQLSTIGMSSGKWYAEIRGVSTTGGFYNAIGLGKDGASGYLGSSALGWGYHQDGRKIAGGGAASYGATYAQGDVIGVAFDADNGTLTFYKNGSSQGTAYTGLTSGPYFFAVGSSQTKNVANFGQRAFAHAAPSGFKCLTVENLPDPTGPAAEPNKYFDAKLYTGNQSVRSIPTSFSPDFVWIKDKTAATHNHNLLDIVRGAPKILQSDTTATEITDSTDGLTSFNSDGFSLGANVLGNQSYELNKTGNSYVAWAWDAGTVANPVSLWSTGATKYIGIKFASASGGTVHYGQTSGSTTVQVWTSSDNSSWTQQGGTQTLSTGHTLTTSDQYVYIRNTSDATFTNWYSAASDGADGHYSSSTYPSGASWTGPAYTDHDFRGGGTLIAAGSISSGVPSIASIVRANPSAGFSIVSYTGGGANGSTIGHGLNKKPELIFLKSRTAAENWFVNHPVGTGNGYLMLNQTNAGDGSNATVWNSTAPTSSVFTIGSSSGVNGSQNYIAYCFSPISGYSAMSSFVGNGSSNGTFVHTGFKPAFLILKATSATGSWIITDNKLNNYNVTGKYLVANTSGAEDTGGNIDFLSNGFKLRLSSANFNGSGVTYLYMAFAENPFKSARAH